MKFFGFSFGALSHRTREIKPQTAVSLFVRLLFPHLLDCASVISAKTAFSCSSLFTASHNSLLEEREKSEEKAETTGSFSCNNFSFLLFPFRKQTPPPLDPLSLRANFHFSSRPDRFFETSDISLWNRKENREDDAYELVLLHTIQCFVHEPADCRGNRSGPLVWTRRTRGAEEKR